VSDALDPAMMRRAIGLARARLGQTWPNPAVGCVLVKHGAVIGEAATAPGGRPHAEEQALMAAGDKARGGAAYVTLEPCGQRSSGALSCSERLAAAGVARVAIACANPDPLSAGLGPARLIQAGVAVESGVLADEAEPLYRAFHHRLATGLPLVEASADGDGFDGPFERRASETAQDALKRYAAAGYTRLWAPVGSPEADQLKALGLLAEP
jgi:diaminohydroxyphosphoribosylaminopyrimidine deaminase/5-amino-6-(5-phosphoribosylamino)uracil reductase